MSRILVSILSGYLQPNYLLIKELEGQYDKLVFISTEDMESEEKKRSYWISTALGLDNEVTPIKVLEDNSEAIKRELESIGFSKEDEYLVNITGGTKIMSIATYNFFSQFDAKFYYLPVNKNIYYSVNEAKYYDIKYRVNLWEYFTLHGLWYECDNTLKYCEQHTDNLFNRFKRKRFDRNRCEPIRDAKLFNKSQDKVYYSGAWFEEYSFNRLKRELQLNEDSIAKGSKIHKTKTGSNDNEIDVMFVKDNQLYIIECKVTISDPDKIYEYLYKLAAISKDYGLIVKPYLYTLENLYKNEQTFNEQKLNNLKKRCLILGIRKIMDCNDFVKPEISL